ncbi:MAG TPA: hypothetical protein VGO43_02050 [Pyrinomonadaceae bacterium]|jgi:TRAP-type C4-dicarboxylate transport system permease small subunit|nr:hypothetical protein [Pyrinomonadaceae bacterium]
MPSRTKKIVFLLAGIASAFPCLFFTWYTARLAYLNLTMTADEVAAHRTGGMLIGAIAFPLAAIIFGLISWFLIRKARQSS